MIWFLFAAMALLVVVALLWPLLRNPPVPADRSAYDLTVLRDQLQEVERDLARGVLTAAEAESARIEIKRRMLAAAKIGETPMGRESPQARSLLTAGLAVAVPFLALGLYMLVGTPQFSGHQARETADQADDAHNAEMGALVEKLAARMRERPDDSQGWQLLARSYRQMARYADAAEAYRNLMRLEPEDADGFAGFGEMATALAGGTVSAAAHEAFVQALKLDHDEPRSQFYLGLEKAQGGDAPGAIAIWRALTASAPQDTPWLPMVRAQMAQVAQTAGVMPMSVPPRYALDAIGETATARAAPPPSPPAPSPPTPPPANDAANPDVGALQGRFSPENLGMIQGMVGGLAARLQNNPDDFDGWMLLGRSYTVLKNVKGASDAYTHAIALKPADITPKLRLAELMLQENGTAAPKPELVKLATDVRKLDGNQPLALFILGSARAEGGDAAEARHLWQEAMAHLPQEAPLRSEIARRLAALK